MNDSESFQRASSAALRFLSYRPRSEAEVRARLRLRFPSGVVERVITSLKEQSLVDDSKFAHQWRDYRDRIKPRSASAIKRELVQKGVARDTAETAVIDMDDYDSAYRSAVKPAMRIGDVDFLTFRRRLWGHLQRRGYSYAVTRRTVDRLWDEVQKSRAELLEDAEGC